MPAHLFRRLIPDTTAQWNPIPRSSTSNNNQSRPADPTTLRLTGSTYSRSYSRPRNNTNTEPHPHSSNSNTSSSSNRPPTTTNPRRNTNNNRHNSSDNPNHPTASIFTSNLISQREFIQQLYSQNRREVGNLRERIAQRRANVEDLSNHGRDPIPEVVQFSPDSTRTATTTETSGGSSSQMNTTGSSNTTLNTTTSSEGQEPPAKKQNSVQQPTDTQSQNSKFTANGVEIVDQLSYSGNGVINIRGHTRMTTPEGLNRIRDFSQEQLQEIIAGVRNAEGIPYQLKNGRKKQK